MNIRTRLIDLAAQENCDGEPYDTMMIAADCILDLSTSLENLLSRVANDKDARNWFLEEQSEAAKALKKALDLSA